MPTHRQMPTPISGFALGSFAFIPPGRILTADPGTYALTGADVALVRHGPAFVGHRQMPMSISGFALGGFGIIPPGRGLIANAGAYALTGTAAILAYGRNTKGTNLIINGDFPVNTSPWIVVGTDTTFTSVSGEGVLALGPGASSGYAYQAVLVVPGARYKLTAFLDPTTTSHAGIQAGMTIGGAQLGFVELAYPHSAKRTFRFTAPPSGVVYVSIYASAALSCSAGFDQIALTGPVPGSPTVDYGIYTITGSDATLTKNSRSLVASGGTYAVAGSAAALVVRRHLAAAGGAYGWIGTPAQLRVGRYVAAASGSYALTGADANLTHVVGRFIAAAKGAYALAGSDARLLVSHKMPAAAGSYALAGAAVGWVYRRAIKADPATYAITGAAAGLKVGYRLPAASSTYVLNGTDLALVNRRLTADSGVYTVAGANARLLAGKRLPAASGVYPVTGAATSLMLQRRFNAAAGSYAFAPTNAILRAGRRVQALGGVYVISGAAARVVRGYTVRATSGAYTLSGMAMRPALARRMSLGSRDFQLTWLDVRLAYRRTPPGPRCVAVLPAADRRLAVPA